jgi:hypothetical protein
MVVLSCHMTDVRNVRAQNRRFRPVRTPVRKFRVSRARRFHACKLLAARARKVRLVVSGYSPQDIRVHLGPGFLPGFLPISAPGSGPGSAQRFAAIAPQRLHNESIAYIIAYIPAHCCLRFELRNMVHVHNINK